MQLAFLMHWLVNPLGSPERATHAENMCPASLRPGQVKPGGSAERLLQFSNM